MTAPAAAPRWESGWTNVASGRLADFQAAGVLSAADIHVARRVGHLGDEGDESVLLACALAVRAARLGSVCLDLVAAPAQIIPMADDESGLPAGADPLAGVAVAAALPWPEPDAWASALAASALVDAEGRAGGGRPLRLERGLLYLDRYWQQEELVAGEIGARADRSLDTPPAIDESRLAAALERLLPAAETGAERQREAALLAARRWITVLAGGPGTGKTTTVAKILALLADQPGPAPHIALAAPTGKAAARLTEAVHGVLAGMDPADRARVGDVQAMTLHRLLGRRMGSKSRFRHHAGNRLAHDIVVVDESSMISLTMMARLLDAVRADARLVLIGDPDQLESVEAGAVLSDIVDAGSAANEAARHGIVVLDRSWRFEGTIARLAEAIQEGDADAAMAYLRKPAADVSFVELDAEQSGFMAAGVPTVLSGLHDDVVDAARRLVAAARDGDVAEALGHLNAHRLLCAHRHGPYGVDRWGLQVERWIDAAIHVRRDGGEWYLGRPLLVTANDYDVGVFNGDTGVVVSDGAGGVRACFGQPEKPLTILPARLAAVQSMYAMTVHRSQGSQFGRVTVLLPDEGSRLLTRQLLYTAVTRAQRHVRVIATEAAVRAAVATPIARASGLRRRLWQAGDGTEE